jgi:hypothetical protein
MLPELEGLVSKAEGLIAGWAEDKPWIGEDDTKKASDKVCVCVCVGTGVLEAVVCVRACVYALLRPRHAQQGGPRHTGCSLAHAPATRVVVTPGRPQTQLSEFKAWLSQQTAAQAKKAPTEDPAFLTADVAAKWEGVQKLVLKTDRKAKPKSPPAAASAAHGSGTEAGATDAHADADADAAAAAGAAAAGAGEGGAQTAGDAQQQQGSSGKAARSEKGASEAAADEEALPTHEEL